MPENARSECVAPSTFSVGGVVEIIFMFHAASPASQRPAFRPTRGSGDGAVADTMGATGFGMTDGGGRGGGGLPRPRLRPARDGASRRGGGRWLPARRRRRRRCGGAAVIDEPPQAAKPAANSAARQRAGEESRRLARTHELGLHLVNLFSWSDDPVSASISFIRSISIC